MSGSGSGTWVPAHTRRSGSARAASSATLTSASAAQTRRLGAALGALSQPGDVILLEGDLGAGKTALTQGIAAGMGIHAVINSPTFTILKEYAGEPADAPPLYHFDLYRIEDPDEVYALGFDDYFGDAGVCVIEWAERGAPREPTAPAPWPADALRIRICRDQPQRPQHRQLAVDSGGPRSARLLAEWLRVAATPTSAMGAADAADATEET